MKEEQEITTEVQAAELEEDSECVPAKVQASNDATLDIPQNTAEDDSYGFEAGEGSDGDTELGPESLEVMSPLTEKTVGPLSPITCKAPTDTDPCHEPQQKSGEWTCPNSFT